MYYYIIKDEKTDVYSIIESPTESYTEFQKEYFEYTIVGRFGKKEYAQKWAEYYIAGGYKVNGPINI